MFKAVLINLFLCWEKELMLNNMKRYPKDSYTNPDFDMNKIKLTYKATYIDGGTNLYIGSDGKSYYEDYRLQTKTKGALYNDYPDHSSAKILNWGDFEIDKKSG